MTFGQTSQPKIITDLHGFT